MAGEWETVPLDTLIEDGRRITYGIVQPGIPVADGVPIVRVGDVRDGRVEVSSPMRVAPAIEAAYERSRIAGGELLLTLVGTVGEAAIAPSSLAGWNTARAVAVIPVRKEVGAYWVKLALQAPGVREIIDARLNTTVQATLNLGDVARLPIVLPPINERSAIAHILGVLDDKIKLNRQMGETFEAMARALFDSWFVDFDPVRAKSSGRDPMLSAAVARLFPEAFEDSELGEIPKGWCIRRASDVIGFVRGVEPGRRACNEEGRGLRFIRVGEVTGKRTSKLFTEIDTEARCSLGDVLLALDGSPGAVSFDLDGVYSSGIRKLVPKSEGLSQCYVWLLATSKGFQDTIREHATGTTIQHAGSAIEHFRVTDPGTGVLRAFSITTGSVWQRLMELRHENTTLSSLRDTLLPKLISGELRIRDAERLVAGAAP